MDMGSTVCCLPKEMSSISALPNFNHCQPHKKILHRPSEQHLYTKLPSSVETPKSYISNLDSPYEPPSAVRCDLRYLSY